MAGEAAPLHVRPGEMDHKPSVLPCSFRPRVRILASLLAVTAGCLVFPSPARAQNATPLTGRVLGDDGYPVPGVVVRVTGTAAEAASGPSGRYVLPRVTAGTHLLQFRL